MIASTIYNQLKATLKNNPDLNVYVEQVFDGYRYSIEPDSLPCIMLQVRADNEPERDYNNVANIWFELDIWAVVEAQEHPEFAIVGDQQKGYYGILDLTNSIKACLTSSNTLGDIVIDTTIGRIDYLDMQFDNFATQTAKLPIRILYRQTDGV